MNSPNTGRLLSSSPSNLSFLQYVSQVIHTTVSHSAGWEILFGLGASVVFKPTQNAALLLCSGSSALFCCCLFSPRWAFLQPVLLSRQLYLFWRGGAVHGQGWAFVFAAKIPKSVWYSPPFYMTESILSPFTPGCCHRWMLHVLWLNLVSRYLPEHVTSCAYRLNMVKVWKHLSSSVTTRGSAVLECRLCCTMQKFTPPHGI